MNQLIVVTIITVLTILFSNSIYATQLNSKNCSPPHHFQIIGPVNSHIMKVKRFEYEGNNLEVRNITSDGFDVVSINEQDCIVGAIELKVGTDKAHWSEMTMVDSDHKITIISKDILNNFHVELFDETNWPDINIVYVQD